MSDDNAWLHPTPEADIEAERARLRADLEVTREALDRARRALAEERQALAVERQISNAARIYIMYTQAKYPGDENQVDMFVKWLEACKKRQGAE